MGSRLFKGLGFEMLSWGNHTDCFCLWHFNWKNLYIVYNSADIAHRWTIYLLKTTTIIYLFNGNTWSAGCAIIIRWNFVDEVVSGAVFCALFITIRNVLLTSIMLKFKDKPALFSVLDNNPKDSIKWLWLKTCEKLSPWSESSLLIVELCKEWNPARRHMTHTHCHHQQPALVPSISFYWNHI